MLNENQTPDVLFKYRSWNTVGKKMLRDGEIYFTSPREFNDPFDCKLAPEALNNHINSVTSFKWIYSILWEYSESAIGYI